MNVTLRPVQEADRPFLEAVYASVRASEFEPLDWTAEQKMAFLRQQFDALDRGYRSQFRDATLDIILVDGQPAGRLYVDRWPDEIRLVDLSLLPEGRGRGVGTILLERLQLEAAASNRSLSLHVERFNPAQQLYLRLGFELVEAGQIYLLMRWSPSDRPASTG
jgi:GNAT superfamily N-acetyltransferase